MKKTLPAILMFAILIFALPFAGLLAENLIGIQQNTSSPLQINNTQNQSSSSQTTQPFNQPQQDSFKIYNESTKNVDTVSIKDYVIGAVAAEMPMTYHDEALKAQAVASLSYALSLKELSLGGDPSLNGAHFSANPALRMGYMTYADMQSFWGDEYSTNITRLEGIYDSLQNIIVTYDNSPALTCYHAISTGTTQSSESVWGQPLAYLVSVDSPFDITSEEYNSKLTFSITDMQDSLLTQNILPEGDPSTWFGEPILSQAGYVQSITIGGTQYTGTQVREALGLRSSAFNIVYTDTFVFEIMTRGYGHGVGMSQFGANAMALTGKTYKEILTHYFPGTSFGYI